VNDNLEKNVEGTCRVLL